jgi:hypothetical protein
MAASTAGLFTLVKAYSYHIIRLHTVSDYFRTVWHYFSVASYTTYNIPILSLSRLTSYSNLSFFYLW